MGSLPRSSKGDGRLVNLTDWPRGEFHEHAENRHEETLWNFESDSKTLWLWLAADWKGIQERLLVSRNTQRATAYVEGSYQVSDHILVHSNFLKVFLGEDLSWGSPKIQPETEPVRRVCVSRMSWRPPSQIAADLGSEVSLCMHSGTKSRMRSWQPLDFGSGVFFVFFSERNCHNHGVFLE